MFRRTRSSKRLVATILFTDIVASTELAMRLGDRAWRELLVRYRAHVRRALRNTGGHEIDSAGDGFFALFDAPVDAFECALTIRRLADGLGIRVRSGVHTGEIELADGKATGIGVHIAARIQALAEPDAILVSSTARDLASGSGMSLTPAGEYELRGVQGRWQLYVLADPGMPQGGTALVEPLGRRRQVSVGVGAVTVAGVVVTVLVLAVAVLPRATSTPSAPPSLQVTPAAGVVTTSSASQPSPTAGQSSAQLLPTVVVRAGDSAGGSTDASAPRRMLDGVSEPGTYLIGNVPGGPVITLADPWNSYSGDNYERISIADRPGNSITFAAATAVPVGACGTSEQRLVGDPATAFLAWLRTSKALIVGTSVVRGAGPDASTQVDVNPVPSQACATDPRTVRLVPLTVSPPGITLVVGSPTRLLVHDLGNRVLVVAVQAPTNDEFDRFLPQADAVIDSLHFELP